MAGMLPGVEAARRRRIHQSNTCSSSSPSSSSRRLSFSLFSTNPNINASTTSASTFLGNTSRARSWTSYEDDVVDEEDDTKLGALAREAKFRLDAKLRSPPLALISTTRNYNRDERISRFVKENQVSRKKKKNGKVVNKLSWSWKTGDRNHNNNNNNNNKECAVCLDDMKEGDDIIDLECHHTFHTNCLMPWLHTNAHCPCCRLRIIHPL